MTVCQEKLTAAGAMVPNLRFVNETIVRAQRFDKDRTNLSRVLFAVAAKQQVR